MKALQAIFKLVVGVLAVVGIFSLLTPSPQPEPIETQITQSWDYYNMPRGDYELNDEEAAAFMKLAETVAGVEPGFMPAPEFHFYDAVTFTPDGRLWIQLIGLPALMPDGRLVQQDIMMVFTTEHDPQEYVTKMIVGNILMLMCPRLEMTDPEFHKNWMSCHEWTDTKMSEHYGVIEHEQQLKQTVDPMNSVHEFKPTSRTAA